MPATICSPDPRRDTAALPAGQQVITESHTDRQSTFLVRSNEPIQDPTVSVTSLNLEDLVLAYMGSAKAASARPMLEGTR